MQPVSLSLSLCPVVPAALLLTAKSKLRHVCFGKLNDDDDDVIMVMRGEKVCCAVCDGLDARKTAHALETGGLHWRSSQQALGTIHYTVQSMLLLQLQTDRCESDKPSAIYYKTQTLRT